jgi:hypothetical protein
MASNTPSLNKLVEIIGLVSRNHRMVRDFRFGPLWDMNALKDLQTPYIWCEEAQSRIAIANSGGGPGVHKTGLYTFRLYCMDRIQKDQSNYNEILSDTKFILDTIMTNIDQHPLFIQLGLSIDAGDIVFEPVYEETDVNANGHSVEFTLRFPIRYTPCNVPIDPLAGFTYSLDNNVFNYSVVGVPGPTGPQGITGPTGVQGPTGPQGVRGFQGAGGTVSAYGIFYDTSIQTNDTTYNKMTFNSTGGSNLVNISNGSEINISIKGTYNIQFSAQVDKTDSGSDDIEIWLSKNGNTEPWSNTRLTLPGNNNKLVAAWNWMVNANPGDYYEIIWQSDDVDIRLFAEASPPAQVEIPSVILTVQLLTFQGPQGPIGFQGFQGITGPQGFTGSQGDTGPQGVTGPQGITGSQGTTGPQGDAGPQGDIGPIGPQGTTGANGQSTSYYNYKANTIDLSGDPGSGYILWDDPNPVAAKTINISHINNDGVDIDIFLALIKSGDILILQDTTNSNRYQRYIVGDPPVLQTGYVQYDIDNQFSNITFNNDDPVTLFIITQGTPGPQGATGNQGATGPQGPDGPQGPQGLQPVFNTTAISALWYNGGDLVDPAFNNVNQSYTDGEDLYITKGSLILVEDITSPLTNKVSITAETLTDNRVWTIPDSTDTFLGKDTYASITNKKFTQVILAPGNVQIKGDIYYSPTTGGDLQRLGIGSTGSLLTANNNIPAWLSPGVTNSVLTITGATPSWKLRNLIKSTDGNGVTGTTTQTFTDAILIPANTISVGDVVELRARFRKTGVAGTMTSRWFIGTASNAITGATFAVSTGMAATTLTGQMIRTFVVKSATQSEFFPLGAAALIDDGAISTAAVSVLNIDWTSNLYWQVGMLNSSAADNSRTSFLQIRILE